MRFWMALKTTWAYVFLVLPLVDKIHSLPLTLETQPQKLLKVETEQSSGILNQTVNSTLPQENDVNYIINLLKLNSTEDENSKTLLPLLYLETVTLCQRWEHYKDSNLIKRILQTLRPSMYIIPRSNHNIHPSLKRLESSMEPEEWPIFTGLVPVFRSYLGKSDANPTTDDQTQRHYLSEKSFAVPILDVREDDQTSERLQVPPSMRLFFNPSSFCKKLNKKWERAKRASNDEYQSYNTEGSEIVEPAFIVPKNSPQTKLPSPSTGPVRTFGLTIKDGKFLRKEFRKDNGEFTSIISSMDGSISSDFGTLVPTKDGGQVLVKEGSYTFTTPEGLKFRVLYKADETGYHAKQVPVVVDS